MKDIIYLNLHTGKEFSGCKHYRDYWKEQWETTELGIGENGREKFNMTKKDILDTMEDFFEDCEWCEKVRVIE